MAFDLMQTLGLGKKGASFDTYTPEDYTQLKNLLYGVQEKGFPEIMSKEYWGEPWRQTSQDIRELYEGKRGMGAGSTPEVSQLGFAQSDLMSKLLGQNLGVRQNALGLLSGITPRPQTTYTPEYNPMEDFSQLLGLGLGFQLPSYLSAMGSGLTGLLNQGAKSVTPEQDLSKFYIGGLQNNLGQQNSSGEETDWGNIGLNVAGTAAKFLPLLLGLL